MSEVEFVVKTRKLSVKIGDKKVSGRFPFHGETKEYLAELRKAKPEDAITLSEKFLNKLGFGDEVLGNMDQASFMEFASFVLSGGEDAKK